jgi:hypothetical protein
VQRIASLDAHPTAYYDVFFQTSWFQETLNVIIMDRW